MWCHICYKILLYEIQTLEFWLYSMVLVVSFLSQYSQVYMANCSLYSCVSKGTYYSLFETENTVEKSCALIRIIMNFV